MKYNVICMQIKIPKQLAEIITAFQENNSEIYIVGGAVRDTLLGNNTYDWDLTTNTAPEDMLKIFPDAFYDNAFGTVGIENEIEGTRPYEITTFRTEAGYSDTRHPDKIEWGKTLEEDLARREATISSMSFKIRNHKSEIRNKLQIINHKSQTVTVNVELIDPFDGKSDLDNRIFRAVGDPDERYREDALRMMRAIRISAQLGFTIEEKTFNGIKNNAHLIHKIANERVGDEIIKIFKSNYPYEGMLLFKNSGLLKEVLPEMESTFGVEQKSPGRHHIYDVGTHSLMALKHCPSKDSIVRFATFIHDSGKAKTYKKLGSGTITFYNHELVSTNNAYNIAKRLRFSKKDTEKLIKLVRWHQFTVDERQTDSAIRRFIRNVGIENVPDILDLRVGDRLGGGATETSWRLEEFKKRLIEVQKQPFSVRDLKISGDDIMKILDIPPGPKVGEILNLLFEKVVEKEVENDKDELINELKKHINRRSTDLNQKTKQ
ncbi:MAG: tRNA adenylyl-/cytidylyl-transferase [Candidatus Woesebacteria bacterium GW2011_GWB1_38_5]|uniref:tRNA adenylyl-/cytidylyl-transferase n=4 Tax=Candidatus Woeseibacteriota TaxID=1752722 RepID=A0A0G0K4G3_9BACT|nr:MAG: tRNA adenylyl-/cytidylyl-transferase [Candidatus Woesebacteria bacterium GW2011_GWD1_38_10]KKQ55838.1 MAG: tRNA adenylyl-/cytidylyl-transferase [Candidatus Woesebacteria bacterium GW2011_GWC1_38_13]KKQ73672.1 MAG: tRNA adenylyl-/cytidylyl-transferase [Candidatus Woesebacteria bacterium GW2011_GWB1_38_5]